MKTTFPWGTVVRRIDIAGKYEIIEYIVGDSWEDRGKTQYHVANGSYGTLEGAMLACVCGYYSQDDHLFDYAYRLIAGSSPEDSP